MKIKRYTVVGKYGGGVELVENEKGSIVKFEDIEHLIPDKRESPSWRCMSCRAFISNSFLQFHNGDRYHSECLKKMLEKERIPLTRSQDSVEEDVPFSTT